MLLTPKVQLTIQKGKLFSSSEVYLLWTQFPKFPSLTCQFFSHLALYGLDTNITELAHPDNSKNHDTTQLFTFSPFHIFILPSFHTFTFSLISSIPDNCSGTGLRPVFSLDRLLPLREKCNSKSKWWCHDETINVFFNSFKLFPHFFFKFKIGHF